MAGAAHFFRLTALLAGVIWVVSGSATGGYAAETPVTRPDLPLAVPVEGLALPKPPGGPRPPKEQVSVSVMPVPEVRTAPAQDGALSSAPTVTAGAEKTHISRFRLDNGLEVVVLEVPNALVVTHMLWYRVGAADDPPGKSGLAHFVEHMMFQGTAQQPPGDFLRAVERMGGEKNAFTTPDFTAYYVHIAKQHLPEIMRREADRMQFMNPPEAAFVKEREVILEERRQQVETDPGNRLREEIDAALFLHHPYRTPVIGWQAEMETLNREDVLAFQRARYAPNNALLVLAGGIGASEAKELATRYYGAIPAKTLPARVHWVEPAAKASQSLEYRDAQVQQPSYMESWQVPSVAEGTARALPYFVLSAVLGESNSSRLFQQLVVGERLATEAGTDYTGLAIGPGRFTLWAVPTGTNASDPNKRTALVQSAQRQLAQLAKEGVDAEELTRVKNQLKASAIYATDGVQQAASLLGQLVMLGLPEDYLSRWPAEIEAVTAAQVQAAARDLLGRRHVEGWLLPPLVAEAPEEAKTPTGGPAIPGRSVP